MLPPSAKYILPNAQHIAYIHFNPLHENNNYISTSASTSTSPCQTIKTNMISPEDSKRRNSCGIFFLPGFQSKMRSTKANAIYDYCQQSNIEFTTLDYYAHGESSYGPDDYYYGNDSDDDDFLKNKQDSCHQYDRCAHGTDIMCTDIDQFKKQGTISRWMQDALTILNHVTKSSQQILVGSSMGSWIMILLTLHITIRRNENASDTSNSTHHTNEDTNNEDGMKQIKGLIGIASAPDFTKLLEELIFSNNDDGSSTCCNTLKEQMNQLGYCDVPTKYYDHNGGECTYRIFRELLDDAKQHFLLSNINKAEEKDDKEAIPCGRRKEPGKDPLPAKCVPVTLLHGTKDEDIPFKFSEQLLQYLASSPSCCFEPKQLVLIENGDHRLSSDDDIKFIINALDEMMS